MTALLSVKGGLEKHQGPGLRVGDQGGGEFPRTMRPGTAHPKPLVGVQVAFWPTSPGALAVVRSSWKLSMAVRGRILADEGHRGRCGGRGWNGLKVGEQGLEKSHPKCHRSKFFPTPD